MLTLMAPTEVMFMSVLHLQAVEIDSVTVDIVKMQDPI